MHGKSRIACKIAFCIINKILGRVRFVADLLLLLHKKNLQLGQKDRAVARLTPSRGEG